MVLLLKMYTISHSKSFQVNKFEVMHMLHVKLYQGIYYEDLTPFPAMYKSQIKTSQ